ncbi:MAG: outer membrane protein assembly factor BamD [Deltaproteobacteria bacterium]|nr:outer membrane protein assembly factor BamD [Deltaproteobacteria bacterium]
MKRSLGIILLGLLLGTASCSSLSMPSLPSWPWSSQAPQPNATAEALFAEGTAHFNNKKYALAVDRFQRVKVEYPFSPEVIAAELKLAESYYLNKQYPEAAAAFKEFQTLHPSNENIPFVLYHLGLVHFEQFTSSDRYQKVTEIAKGYFEQVVKNHANSPYAAQAKEKLVKCLEYLFQREEISCRHRPAGGDPQALCGHAGRRQCPLLSGRELPAGKKQHQGRPGL